MQQELKSYAENDDKTQFDQPLQELKDLCSQLHHAANYCETTFLNAQHKTPVMENTKEYICKAVVTMIDHLGSMSYKLESSLSKSDSISETELRINSLQQRLVTCQEYSNKLTISRLSWSADFPRYYPRYKASITGDLTQGSNINHSAPKSEPLFEFQEKRKLKRNLLNWKNMQNKDLISLIRRGRRTSK